MKLSLWFLPICLAALLLAGCAGAPDGPESSASKRLVISTWNVNALAIRLERGNIAVRAVPGADSVVADAEISHTGTEDGAGKVGFLAEVDETGTLHFSIDDRPVKGRTQASLTVSAPPQLALELRTKLGTLSAHDLTAPLNLRSDEGNVTASLATVPDSGSVEVKSGDGDATLHLPGGGAYAFEVATTYGAAHVDGLASFTFTENVDTRKAGRSGPDTARRLPVHVWAIHGDARLIGR